MTKQNVVKFRDEIFKGLPMIVVCDNDHNFFDNYPGQSFPVWDDENECVTWFETYHQQAPGSNTDDYPLVLCVTEYAQIQSIRAYADRSDIMKYLRDTKADIGEDKHKCNIEIVSKVLRNSRPTLVDGRPVPWFLEKEK